MLSMHCTLPWNGLALQIRRFEMPPLCKLAMWHFCVRRKGHPTCWILPNLENHTCLSHPHMSLITQCDSPEVSRPLYIEDIKCAQYISIAAIKMCTCIFSPSSTCLLKPCVCTCVIEAMHSLSADLHRRGLLWLCASLLPLNHHSMALF